MGRHREKPPPATCPGPDEQHAVECRDIVFELESFKIAPDLDATYPPDTLEHRARIYDGNVKGWLLDCAAKLNEYEHAGFAVLHLGLGYFEAHAPYCTGGPWAVSERAFAHGVRCVFPGLHEAAVAVLWEARNGFFHEGIVGERLVLSDGEPTFRYELRPASGEARVVLVDRYRFIGAIMRHHERFLTVLRDTAESVVQERFMSAWESVRGAESIRRKRRRRK